MSKLALLGGEKAVRLDPRDSLKWPVFTKEHEDAVIDVLRRGAMSGSDVTKQFETEFADWLGVKYALGYNNGTASLHAAMYACGVGAGDEIICPSITYWASCAQVYSLGGTVVFCDVDRDTLCIDPKDIEHRITPRTKAIVVVHYLGYPADMDAIMAIAERHNIKVIEDVSHAHGGLYKGRKLGSIGHIAGMSLMSGKAFAVGEAGILVTNDLKMYEKAVSLGHYERFDSDIQSEELKPFIGLPLGGYKYRMHQMSSAVGRVVLRHYDGQLENIRSAMNYFWDQLEGVPGITAHRCPKSDETTKMGGWYEPRGIYRPQELGGLSVTRFAEAVRAEGAPCQPGCNAALHTHALFNTCDVYGHGKPTRIANSGRDVREGDKNLAVSEQVGSLTFSIPWFKKLYPDVVKEYAFAFKKVAENYRELLEGDQGNPQMLGGWHFFSKR